MFPLGILEPRRFRLAGEMDVTLAGYPGHVVMLELHAFRFERVDRVGELVIDIHVAAVARFVPAKSDS